MKNQQKSQPNSDIGAVMDTSNTANGPSTFLTQNLENGNQDKTAEDDDFSLASAADPRSSMRLQRVR